MGEFPGEGSQAVYVTPSRGELAVAEELPEFIAYSYGGQG